MNIEHCHLCPNGTRDVRRDRIVTVPDLAPLEFVFVVIPPMCVRCRTKLVDAIRATVRSCTGRPGTASLPSTEVR
jgi:hypothetical protein